MSTGVYQSLNQNLFSDLTNRRYYKVRWSRHGRGLGTTMVGLGWVRREQLHTIQ